MKLGIISNKSDGPLAKALELVYKNLLGWEIELLPQAGFQPGYVTEKSLDALLVEGRSDSDEGFAIAIRRNVPETVKMCYFRIYRPTLTSELEKYRIDSLDILDVDLKEKFTKWLGGA